MQITPRDSVAVGGHSVNATQRTIMSLSILLPATSRSPQKGYVACETYVETLLRTIHGFLHHNPTSNVVCGMDADDPASRLFSSKLMASPSRSKIACHIFQEQGLIKAKQMGLSLSNGYASNRHAAPICWMWQKMALHAQHKFQSEAMVLLGDDTKVSPNKWVQKALGTLW